ncbi:hypothetical protein [Agromyces sp. ZXT2-3]|uniref:hypothetical protein n=1 Tax=Agromyces sp. ZXT2-3 TaxID=3461152 RepID=UPI004054D1B6
MSFADQWAKPDLGDELLVALGAVAYWSGRLEERLFWLAASLLDPWYSGFDDPDERALAATRGLGFDALRQLVIRVLDVEGRDSHPELRRTLRDAETLMKERNRVVHGEWWPYEEEERPIITHRNWRSVGLSDVRVEDLRDLANKLAAVTDRVELAQSEGHPKTRGGTSGGLSQ